MTLFEWLEQVGECGRRLVVGAVDPGIGQVAGGYHRDHAGCGGCLRHVEIPDSRMGMGASQYDRFGGARQPDIGYVDTLALEEPAVLPAEDGLAEGRADRHGSSRPAPARAACNAAETMLW